MAVEKKRDYSVKSDTVVTYKGVPYYTVVGESGEKEKVEVPVLFDLDFGGVSQADILEMAARHCMTLGCFKPWELNQTEGVVDIAVVLAESGAERGPVLDDLEHEGWALVLAKAQEARADLTLEAIQGRYQTDKTFAGQLNTLYKGLVSVSKRENIFG